MRTEVDIRSMCMATELKNKNWNGDSWRRGQDTGGRETNENLRNDAANRERNLFIDKESGSMKV